MADNPKRKSTRKLKNHHYGRFQPQEVEYHPARLIQGLPAPGMPQHVHPFHMKMHNHSKHNANVVQTLTIASFLAQMLGLSIASCG